MAKIHDVVETSKMSMEYDGSLIDVERSAAADIDNGRLVVRDGATYKYAVSEAAARLWLTTAPEKTYSVANMTEFYNKSGKKLRAVEVMLGDQFGTTAIVGSLSVGDVVMVKGTTGELMAKGVATPAIEFTVVEKKLLSGFSAVVVERTK